MLELAGVRVSATGSRRGDRAWAMRAAQATSGRMELLFVAAMATAPAAAPHPNRGLQVTWRLEAKAAHSGTTPRPPRNAGGAAWGEPAAQSAVQLHRCPADAAAAAAPTTHQPTYVDPRSTRVGTRQTRRASHLRPAAAAAACGPQRSGWRIAQTRRGGERNEPTIVRLDESCTCSATAAIRTASPCCLQRG